MPKRKDDQFRRRKPKPPDKIAAEERELVRRCELEAAAINEAAAMFTEAVNDEIDIRIQRHLEGANDASIEYQI